MTATIKDNLANPGQRLVYYIEGVASTDNAGQFAIANPFGETVLIRQAELVTKVASTGAANLGIGITTVAAKATDVLNDAAVNGLAANHIYNAFAQQATAKTAISAPALWTTALYLTGTASGSMVGYKGYLLLEVIRIGDLA
ncbi:MAG: hypothetical protein HY825_13555 [Acidobacteria bacterium]|nr:hypothetical protein [Acidobacteriota bacterium]